MKRAFWAIIFTLFMISPVYAQQAIPQHEGFVADQADVISGDARQQLREAIAASKRDYGANIAVLSIIDTQGEDPQSLCMRAMNAWGIQSQGVVFLIANQPRLIFVQVTPDQISRFPETSRSQCVTTIMAPLARTGNKSGAFQAGVSWAQGQFMTAAPAPRYQQSGRRYVQTQPYVQEEYWTWGRIIMWTVIIILILLIIFAVANSRGGYGGSSWTFIDFGSSGDSGGGGWSDSGGGGDSGGSGGGY